MIRRHNRAAGDGDTAVPADILMRRGRLFFAVACAVIVTMAATAVLQVALLLFRVGDHAGMLNGGFAFIVTRDDGGAAPAGFVTISRYAVWQSTLAAGLLTLRLIPGLVILASLVGLFRLYARRLIFSADHERWMRRIAWALIAYALVPLVTHAALYAAGMSPVAVKLEWRQLDAAILGILLFAFVDVIAFGAEIERDRAGFF
ncbi:DUF2975 domain-containing protein [Sphingomonas sp. CCH9-F2]|uniref:DUF2975 domain-containing protein n=1 Tax=Sphingomonas sp. CCH9-F2 TaxID=1768778 RepID=UPI000A452AD4|nr:DUF2975 domain-containing protein [Sphingomonas sp. CCH9-F2]